jgi:RNA polymerase sigma factor (sigma-70 family)
VRDEERWIQQLRQGDPEGLRCIYERYKDHLYTVAVYLLVDAAAAEDCLHDVFVQFAQGARGLHRLDNLKGFLATCVANRAHDWIRRSRRLPQTSLDETTSIAVDAAEPVVETAIEREERRRLDAALAQLPYEQREVITLRMHGGLTFQEIARQQGSSINTVQSRYRYGLEKLRMLLDAGARK